MNAPTTSANGTPRPPEARSQRQLVARRFARHKLAVVSLYILVVLHVVALFAEFFAPYSTQWRDLDFTYAPPQSPALVLDRGPRLAAPMLKRHVDPVTFATTYVEVPGERIPLRFFARGEPYRLCGLVPLRVRFLGVDAAAWTAGHPDRPVPPWYLFGADKYGRDIYSRAVYGARISLSVGLVAVAVTFLLGVLIGGISGYLGGAWDTVIQRFIEIVNSFPQLPLWLAIAAIVPADWSALRSYFVITVVLSILNWTGLARVVRGKILALREEDYVTAARLAGAGHARLLFVHLIPGFTSHIIVSLTLAIPAMILGETALSFLGLGLRPPVVSWGVLLQDCMDMQSVANYPWMLLPLLPIVLTVLCLNFLGDGLRDAADPYATRG
jgi:peptide/nickel transport system permease protein